MNFVIPEIRSLIAKADCSYSGIDVAPSLLGYASPSGD